MNADTIKTLSVVIGHLNRVTQYQEVNKMTPPNLAICWGPTLFKGGASVFGIVVNLITGYEYIFS